MELTDEDGDVLLDEEDAIDRGLILDCLQIELFDNKDCLCAD